MQSMTTSEIEEQRRSLGATMRESAAAVEVAQNALREARRVLEHARDVWRCARERGVQGNWQDSAF